MEKIEALHQTISSHNEKEDSELKKILQWITKCCIIHQPRLCASSLILSLVGMTICAGILLVC
jgi:hypothetical protein